MSGRVPPSSRAGRRARPSADEVERAGALYEAFTGHSPEPLARVSLPAVPRVLAVMGEMDAIEYTTTRDGVVERYRHKFHAADKPLVCVTPDGFTIVLVGGAFKWTEAGIVDRSDRKNWARFAGG